MLNKKMSFFINYLKKNIVSNLSSSSETTTNSSATPSSTTNSSVVPSTTNSSVVPSTTNSSVVPSSTTSLSAVTDSKLILNIPINSNMINIVNTANSARLILEIPSNYSNSSDSSDTSDTSDSSKRKIDTFYFSETNTNKISKSCQSQFITSQDINEFAKEFKRRNNIDYYYNKRLDKIYYEINNNIQRIINAKYTEEIKINGRYYNPIEDTIAKLHMGSTYVKPHILSYIEEHDFQHLAYFYKKLNIHVRNLITNIKMYSSSSIQLESIITNYIIELAKLEEDLEEKWRHKLQKIWIRV
jgi:hypothetical protein